MVIAPPIVEPLAAPDSPVLALVPRHDQYAPPERITVATVDWPDVEIEVIESADHFLAGHTGVVAERATEWLRRGPTRADRQCSRCDSGSSARALEALLTNVARQRRRRAQTVPRRRGVVGSVGSRRSPARGDR